LEEQVGFGRRTLARLGWSQAFGAFADSNVNAVRNCFGCIAVTEADSVVDFATVLDSQEERTHSSSAI
jgi:hypothetical protein